MRLLQIAVKIADEAPKTQRSPGVITDITEEDSEWKAPTQQFTPKTQRSPESEAPDSDWKTVGKYIGILKDTIGKLERELPS